MRRRPIGFRVVDLYDKLRGDPFVGRPLRVRLFYPALAPGKPITLHEVLAEWPMSGVDAETWSAMIARERGDLMRLDAPMRATLDASPDRVRHPLVLLAIDRRIDEVARVAEQLALHDWVAAALPRGSDAKDLAFADVELRGLADVDEHRIAIVDSYDGHLRALIRRLSETFSRSSSRPYRAQPR